jgi:hypothetical protein
MQNEKRLRELLTQISHGTHDPMPTRMLPYPDSKAMQVDEWWQNYFLSARDSYRALALDALKLLDENA